MKKRNMNKTGKKFQALMLSGILAAGIFGAVPAMAEEKKEPQTVGTFTIEDINGKEYTEELFAEAELTLVNVFATWCGPCISEVPELQKLSEEMEDEGVQVIGMVMDTGTIEETDEEALETAKLLAEVAETDYPFLIPDEGLMNDRLSGIQAYPETFFVNKDGEIVGESYVGARDLDAWKEIVENELKALKEDS